MRISIEFSILLEILLVTTPCVVVLSVCVGVGPVYAPFLPFPGVLVCLPCSL